MAWLERNQARRVDPQQVLPGARSVIVLAMNYYQGPAPADGRIKGSGLGLAIAREYAVAHGGRIEVLDRADGQRGAWFRLWLPLAPGAGEPSRRDAAVKPRLAGVK